MKKKSEFEAPYIGIETIDNTPIFYNRRGDYSVIIKCENPIIQYSADMDAYYDFHHLFTNILKVLGTGYTIQKQDILCKKSFLPPQNRKNDYLSNRYFEHFKGRIYTDISTYLVITGEVERSKFFSFDPRRFDTFIRNITKVLGLFANRGIPVISRISDDRYVLIVSYNEADIRYYDPVEDKEIVVSRDEYTDMMLQWHNESYTYVEE